MTIRNPADLRAAAGHNRRLMGLDVGTRTIGVAISDLTGMIATPRTVIARKGGEHDMTALTDIIAAEEVGGIVCGLPLQMDGTEGERAEATRRLMDKLMQRVDLPLLYWDERLSTAAVERVLIGQADMSRGKRKKVVDKSAAAYILQGVLDGF